MKISVDYSKQNKCYYCNHNDAEKEASNSVTLYGVTKAGSLSINYMTIDVEIPCCKSCESKHYKMYFFFLLIYILVSSLCACYWWGWFDRFGVAKEDYIIHVVFGIIGILLISSALTYVSVYLSGLFLKNRKTLLDNSGYAPIRKLHGCGFRDSKPRPNDNYKVVNPERLQSALQSIIEKDNCIITQ